MAGLKCTEVQNICGLRCVSCCDVPSDAMANQHSGDSPFLEQESAAAYQVFLMNGGGLTASTDATDDVSYSYAGGAASSLADEADALRLNRHSSLAPSTAGRLVQDHSARGWVVPGFAGCVAAVLLFARIQRGPLSALRNLAERFEGRAYLPLRG
mmetsp:Transcript_9273/g.28060  ORF Transcript_9273/g.28060 Transcript_9273/m.28060 type:complete len:155 (+) Transcript_9273:37-501(+)|eukprot:scaffold239048_cov35-Tisochrysis_lutea.AAC.1